MNAIAKTVMLVAVCSPIMLHAAQTRGQPGDEAVAHGPVTLTADEVGYDRRTDRVHASGAATAVYGERTLLADRIDYRRAEGLVSASGAVRLLEPDGSVLFADSAELTEDMGDGTIIRPSLLLADESRLVANDARREAGNRTVLSRVVYSPCEICEEDPERPPSWQLKAGRAIHDKAMGDIIYHDASLEFLGVPVAYTPYFRHPDPTVERRSGFLSPSYGSSNALGAEVTVPYFWNIAPHRDVTFSPRLTSEEGVVAAGQYRERTGDGQFEFDASLTRTDARDEDGKIKGGQEFRGHVFGSGAFEIDPGWRWGFDVKRALDDTYLRRYGISTADSLTSTLFVEGMDGRSFISGRAYSFQGLEAEDEDDRIPIILPLIDADLVGDELYAGGYFTLSGNIMFLERLSGTDSRRFSVEGGWNRPFVAPGGHLFRIDADLRGDLYHVATPVDPARPTGKTERDAFARAIPRVALEWRLPLVSRSGATHKLVEPIVQAVGSPHGGNRDDIPNEDSQDFEFDHTNLFSDNRFTGFDRVEGGPRLNYGLRLGYYDSTGTKATALVGQSVRTRDNRSFASGSGLEDKRSDYVGRIFVQIPPFLDFGYRFRLDHDNLSNRRKEADLTFGPDWLRSSVSYAELAPQTEREGTVAFDEREEVVAASTARFSDYWNVSAGIRRDLSDEGRTIHWNAGVAYEDECLRLDARMIRTFSRDRDVEQDTRFVIGVNLLNLG